MKIIAIVGLIAIALGLSYLLTVGAIWLIFFILGKIGMAVTFNIWWSGLLLWIILWLFAPKGRN